MTEPPDATEPHTFDPAVLTDSELEAVAAGKQRMGRFVGDILAVAPMVKWGVLPRSALQSRAFRRSPDLERPVVKVGLSGRHFQRVAVWRSGGLRKSQEFPRVNS